jgi:hypothetical protein
MHEWREIPKGSPPLYGESPVASGTKQRNSGRVWFRVWSKEVESNSINDTLKIPEIQNNIHDPVKEVYIETLISPLSQC